MISIGISLSFCYSGLQARSLDADPMLAAAREQGNFGPDEMVPSAVWLGRGAWHWHTHYGPAWVVEMAAMATSGILIWRKFASDLIVQVLAGRIAATLVFCLRMHLGRATKLRQFAADPDEL